MQRVEHALKFRIRHRPDELECGSPEASSGLESVLEPVRGPANYNHLSVRSAAAIILDRLLRMPSGPGKPEAIRQAISGAPDCAFGNSIWDREMLEMSPHPFAINPNPNLKEIARANRWTVYQPEVNHRSR